MSETKTCTRCKEKKPLEQFHTDRTTLDQHTRACRTCVATRSHVAWLNKPVRQTKTCQRCHVAQPLDQFEMARKQHRACISCRSTRTKACKACHETKPLDQFERTARGVHRKFCIACLLSKSTATTKACRTCRVTKPVEDFPRAKNRCGHRSGGCRQCKRAQGKIRRAQILANPITLFFVFV